jgi:hypothetical protein
MRTDTKFRMKVAKATDNASLVAWDTCHKIYIAMDDKEASWYVENKFTTFSGSPDEMLDHVCQWYEQSCGLEFIDATSWDDQHSNTRFVSVIPQGYFSEGYE